MTYSSDKVFWEYVYDRFSSDSLVSTDPIFFPKTLNGNVEFISIISSLFAYGRVNSIKGFLDEFFNSIGVSPENLKNNTKSLYYRFQTPEDIQILIDFLRYIYREYGSLKDMFYSFSGDLENALQNFIFAARKYGKENGAGRGYYFLFPDYGKSGLKRLRMFLRWMVRSDDLDFGLWNKYSPSMLYYPLDTHVLRFAGNYGLIGTESNTHKNTVKITEYFKGINPEDPLKYDFPLTRLGMLQNCIFKNGKTCRKCDLSGECIFN